MSLQLMVSLQPEQHHLGIFLDKQKCSNRNDLRQVLVWQYSDISLDMKPSSILFLLTSDLQKYNVADAQESVCLPALPISCM